MEGKEWKNGKTKGRTGEKSCYHNLDVRPRNYESKKPRKIRDCKSGTRHKEVNGGAPSLLF